MLNKFEISYKNNLLIINFIFYVFFFLLTFFPKKSNII